MAECICLFNKDTLIIKPPKKSPLFSRTIALWFAMMCGVYIYGTCLKHVGTFTKLRFHSIRVIEKPSLEGVNVLRIQSGSLLYYRCKGPGVDGSRLC
ncbi:hypothetical protein V6N11_049144 [Hibiscus sabdariffa]|uniref:Uncharacterized protein n=1 Tax=Hibiscus sabdariffa TaxID=183260 RepID=A0ABR2PXB2_9ROSI